MREPFRAGIRVWLLALALLSLLPLLAFSAYTIYELGRARQDAIRIELLQRSEAAANAVNERLGTTLGYLNALATSDAAQNGDLPGLYAHAQRVVRMNPEATAITLIGPDNRMIFITLRPLGSPTIPVQYPEVVQRVFATGQPAISGPFLGPVSRSPVTSLAVPVFRQGKVAYCLRMILKTDSLNDLLAGQKLPQDWIGSVVDRDGIIVARTRTPERFIGQAVTPSLMAKLKAGGQGIIDSETKDGIAVKTAIAHVPSWDWSIAIGVPKAILHATLWDSLILLIGSGLVFAGVGIAGAIWLARTISRRVRDVVAASHSLRRGEPVPVPHSAIRELDEMGLALTEVHDRGQQAAIALTEATEKQGQLASELQQARNDDLTGLPGRALSLELLADLRADISRQSGRKLALLFIDLDGFKEVNDRYGHDEGDRVLIRTAAILRRQLRESDMAGRLGGDEFVAGLVVPTASADASAGAIAQRIIDQVAGLGQGLGCSIGIALWPDDGDALADTLHCADEAMYDAKRQGKNRFVRYAGRAGD